MRVAAIEATGLSVKTRRICFEEPELEAPRITSSSVVKAAGIEVGLEFDDRTALDAALAPVEREHAKERALRLLGHRERSTAELRRRLGEDGYPASLVANVVAELARLGLVDDERFAAAFTRSRVLAGYGRRKISRELIDHGLSQDDVSSALDETCPDEGELQRALDALGSARPTDRKAADRLLRRLVTRGYDLTTARQAVKSRLDDASPQHPYSS